MLPAFAFQCVLLTQTTTSAFQTTGELELSGNCIGSYVLDARDFLQSAMEFYVAF